MWKKNCKRHTWEPVGADMVPEPENCPNAIYEFYKRSKSGNVLTVDIKSNVRKHLLFLKWNIEYKSQKNCSNRYRYISPDGTKTYHSLNDLCTDLIESAEIGKYSIQQLPSQVEKPPFIPQEESLIKNLSLITQDDNLGIVPSRLLIQQRHCPEAILEYVNLCSSATRDQKSDVKLRDLRMKVKKQICSVGWDIFYINYRNRRELRYVSPISGKTYNSLITACEAYLNEREKYDQIPDAKNKSLKRPTPCQDSSYSPPHRIPDKRARSLMSFDLQRHRCSICKKLDALVLCYQCPSKFHTSCLGLSEVPNGEWFCKACEDEPVNESESESCPEAIVDYFFDGNILTRAGDKNRMLKDLRSKAKKDLVSRGWKFVRVEGENKRELKYMSPSGNNYDSLAAACAASIFGDGDSIKLLNLLV